MTNRSSFRASFGVCASHCGGLVDAALRVVFPPQCVVCDAYLGASTCFCERCAYAVFRLKEPGCERCGETRELRSGDDDGPGVRCARCAERPPAFERARGYWEYSGSVGDAIQRAKYGGRLWIVRSLAAELGPWLRAEIERIAEELRADAISGRPAPLLITCVPTHPRDLRERGFNFGYLLLRACLKSAGYPAHIAHLLDKTRQTRAQAGLGHLDRQINLRGAFGGRAPAELQGRAVLLFDDVYTTGATAHEVAKTLRSAGADKVYILSAARALKP